MHDIRAIRENPAAWDAALSRRGDAPMSSQVLALDEERRAAIHAAETAQADQNKASKSVGAAKASGDEAEFERLRALVATKKAEVAEMTEKAKALDTQLTEVTYVHMLLPRHEIVFANGVETESFHPANSALDSLSQNDRERLAQLLPYVEEEPTAYGDVARRNLSASEAAILLHDAA